MEEKEEQPEAVLGRSVEIISGSSAVLFGGGYGVVNTILGLHLLVPAHLTPPVVTTNSFPDLAQYFPQTWRNLPVLGISAIRLTSLQER